MVKCKNDRGVNSCCGFKYKLILDEDLKKKFDRRLFYRVAFATFKVFLLIFFVIFVVFPLIYKYSYNLQRAIVFLNFVNTPADFDAPYKYGLHGSRNFYVTTNDDVKLGVWQILPETMEENYNKTDSEYFENILANGEPVVIYVHGNSGNRASAHRIELYKVLRKKFHVIAYDYRSYGDSDDVGPTEAGVVRDCMYMYKWVANRTSGNIFVWGHSLGTSLSTHSLALLQQEGVRPTGLILESPFNNMKEEITEFPTSRWFKHLPWFTYTVVDPMIENNFRFETDKHILNVDAPIMILHALDDNVVPFKLGFKLYQTALQYRKDIQGNISLHKFHERHHYGHKYICRAPELHDILDSFVSRALSEIREKHLI